MCGDPSAGRGTMVWLLGNYHPAADRSIDWHGQLPNLGYPDTLVVDMTTLTENTIRQIDAEKFDRIKKSIGDKLFGGGGTIIVITSAEFSAPPIDAATGQPIIPFNGYADPHDCSNYRILPAVLDTEPVDEGGRILPDAGHDFGAYLGAVGHSRFHITEYRQTSNCGPRGARFCLARVDGQDVRDGFGYDLGFTLVSLEAGRGMTSSQAEGAGRLVFLPPYTEPAEDAIGKILSAYGKTRASSEVPPPWAVGMSFDPLPELEAQIKSLEEEKNRVQEKINALVAQKNELRSHLKLLYSSGSELECAVAGAFRILGFAEARRAGGGDSADVVFDMSTGGYLHAVVEVKGVAKRTGLDHLLQCNRWADQQAGVDGRTAKGIFVPNQHRKCDYPGSLNDRCKFEPNELDYAKKRTYALFPAVPCSRR